MQTHLFQPGERVRVVLEGRLSRARIEIAARIRNVSPQGEVYIEPVEENTPTERELIHRTGPFRNRRGDKTFGWQDPSFLFRRHYIMPEASGA